MEYDASRPWLRQPCDTDISFAIFSDYLMVGPARSLKKIKTSLEWGTLCSLAFEDAWEIRARAWDQHLHELRIATQERVTEEDAAARAVRQGKLARKLQRVGELELDRLQKVLERDDGGQIGTLRPHEAIRAVSLGIHAERLALGDTTDKIDTGPNLDALSVDQLRTLKEMQDKIGGGST